MPKKKVAVKYTSRDFESIKTDLVDYAKRYYPDTFRDFGDAGFGSLMLDTVAYVGDMLSFYLDYQANESFLPTAIEYDNVVKLSRQLGYKLDLTPSAFGTAAFYLLIPADPVTLAPDTQYMPVLERGTTVSTADGRGYILNEDVNFGSLEGIDPVSARQDPTTGNTSFFALKAYGQVISGDILSEDVIVGNFEKFRKIKLSGENITEVLSVKDSEGNEYFEVDYLSQDVIYKPTRNRNSDKDDVNSVLTAVPVPRRFIVEKDRTQIVLQFGFGSDSELDTRTIADPSQVVLKVIGRDYFTDKTVDPSRLLQTDKLGVGPSDTTLTIKYRTNSEANMNAAPGALNNVVGPIARFDNLSSLNLATANQVISSLEVSNENSIVGSVSYPTAEEIKKKAYAAFATQNRAVTKQDYITMVYNMPAEFGAVKRCNIVQDKDSFKRNLNLYVISENRAGRLISSNATLKQNLKKWLTSVKMINDTVDILDARVINFGIDFSAVLDYGANRVDVMSDVQAALEDYFDTVPNMGESFFISDIYNVVNDSEGVVDVTDVTIKVLTGGNYSATSFIINDHMTIDGRIIEMPIDFIWEIKYPKVDIKGTFR